MKWLDKEMWYWSQIHDAVLNCDLQRLCTLAQSFKRDAEQHANSLEHSTTGLPVIE